MKYKRSFIFIISTIAAMVFAIVLGRALLYSPANDISIPLVHAPIAEAATTVYPVRLSIPAIHVDAKIQQVGVTASQHMAVPTNFTDVGWYKYGPLPGKAGSVVIDGHVDDGLALPGVFIDLDQLQIGDDIYITMNDGTTAHYVMQSSEVYDRNAPTDTIFTNQTTSLLRLITCTGTWLPTAKTHDQRLVVTAVLQK